MLASEPSSRSSTPTFAVGWCVGIRRTASSPLSGLRTASTTSAPAAARALRGGETDARTGAGDDGAASGEIGQGQGRQSVGAGVANGVMASACLTERNSTPTPAPSRPSTTVSPPWSTSPGRGAGRCCVRHSPSSPAALHILSLAPTTRTSVVAERLSTAHRAEQVAGFEGAGDVARLLGDGAIGPPTEAGEGEGPGIRLRLARPFVARSDGDVPRSGGRQSSSDLHGRPEPVTALVGAGNPRHSLMDLTKRGVAGAGLVPQDGLHQTCLPCLADGLLLAQQRPGGRRGRRRIHRRSRWPRRFRAHRDSPG